MMQESLPIGELNGYLYTVCYDSLIRETAAYLGQPVTSIRHQNQISVEVDEDTVYYTFRAWAETTGGDDEEYKDLRLTCTLRFDGNESNEAANDGTSGCGAGCALSVADAFDMRQEPCVRQKRHGVSADQHLIPDLHDDKRREAEAECFLNRYCPKALTTPMPVPILAIMERMGLTVVTDIQLLGETYGQILFKDDEQLVMNDTGDDIMVVPYRRRTVLIDGEKVFLYGMGFAHYTMAHEAYHWFAHRAYVDFHRIVGAQEGSSYNGSSCYSSSDILEIQANAIASRILMPKEMFLKKYRELSETEKLSKTEKISETEKLSETIDISAAANVSATDNSAVISALAAFFQVSFTAAAIRLSQLGVLDEQSITKTRSVSPDESFALYVNHEDFRELVDSGKILFIGNAYVINDPKYVELDWEDVPTYSSTKNRCPYRLTEYACRHPEEALVTFAVDHERISADGDTLLRESADVLLVSVERIRKNFPEEAKRMTMHANRFEKIFAESAGKYKTYADVARDMVNYRYWIHSCLPISVSTLRCQTLSLRRRPGRTRMICRDMYS